MPKKTDSTIEAAKITSRRAMIAVILAALVTAIGGFFAYNYSKIFSPPQTFSGRALDAKTEARLRGVKVTIENEGAPPVQSTDSEGIFSFPISDPNKEYRLRLELENYQNYDLRVTPAKNQGIQEVRMKSNVEIGAELSGLVLDRQDKPIQGAMVTLDDIVGMAPVETSSDGVFRLKNLPRKWGDGVRVRVAKAGYQPNPFTEDVVLGKTPPRIILTRKK